MSETPSQHPSNNGRWLVLAAVAVAGAGTAAWLLARARTRGASQAIEDLLQVCENVSHRLEESLGLSAAS